MKKFNKTRFAPTPSGYLHIGNICNLLLVQCVAKKLELDFELRIDDIDRGRFRNEYLENIFEVCDYLDIEFNLGPTGVADFEKNFSQAKKINHYQKYFNQISKHLFLCECSRKVLKGYDRYPGTCYNKNLNPSLESNLKARFFASEKKIIYSGNQLNKKLDDFVLWNYNENRPSYQFVSFLEDLENNVDVIVRGDDLLESSFNHECLRSVLKTNGDNVSEISYLHHALIKENNQKISKSVMKNTSRSIKQIMSKKEIYHYFLEWYFGDDCNVTSIKGVSNYFIENVETLSFESVSVISP